MHACRTVLRDFFVIHDIFRFHYYSVRLIKMFKIMICAVALLLLVVIDVFAATVPSLPKGYLSWQKSVRKVETDKNSLFFGIHYIYADKKAMQGYRAGNRFVDGSTIVVDYFKIKEGTSLDGPRNMIVLMRKDKRQKSTGGWLFAGYGADGMPSGLDPVSTCFGCHQKEASQRDFVISNIKDFQR